MVNPFNGLRIISVNTIYSYTWNLLVCKDKNTEYAFDSWLYLNDTDPDGTLSWVVQQLDAAEKAGDKVGRSHSTLLQTYNARSG